jgi:hypothetical protein
MIAMEESVRDPITLECTILLSLCFGASLAAASFQVWAGPSQSGFIDNLPADMKPDPAGPGARAGSLPTRTWADYDRVLLEPLTIYVAPDSEEKGLESGGLEVPVGCIPRADDPHLRTGLPGGGPAGERRAGAASGVDEHAPGEEPTRPAGHHPGGASGQRGKERPQQGLLPGKGLPGVRSPRRGIGKTGRRVHRPGAGESPDSRSRTCSVGDNSNRPWTSMPGAW